MCLCLKFGNKLWKLRRSLRRRRISERIVVQTEDVPGPQNFEEVAEVEKAVPEEGISERTVVQTVGVPVPQNSDEIVEVVRAVKTVPVRTSEHMHEQIVDVSALHPALKERISECVHEQIVDVPVLQKMKDRVELVSRDSAACGDDTTDPSDSRCAEDR